MALGRVSPFRPLPSLGDLDSQLKATPTKPLDELATGDFDPRGGTPGGGDSTGAEGLTSGISGFSGPIASTGLGTLSAMGFPGVGTAGGLMGGTAGTALGGPIGGSLGSLVGSQAAGRLQSAVLGGLPNSLVANNPEEGLVDAPVTFSGNTGRLGNTGFTGMLGNALGALGALLGRDSFMGQTAPRFSVPGTDPFQLANSVDVDVTQGP